MQTRTKTDYAMLLVARYDQGFRAGLCGAQYVETHGVYAIATWAKDRPVVYVTDANYKPLWGSLYCENETAARQLADSIASDHNLKPIYQLK